MVDIAKLDSNFQAQKVEDGLAWYDIRQLAMEGRGWSEDQLPHPFARFPKKAKGLVRDPVWQLSLCSSGLSVRFSTDASRVAVRWSVQNEALALPHMPATGVSGVDLYAREDGGWFWAGTGCPDHHENQERVLIDHMSSRRRQYLLHLPLYNAMATCLIGLPQEASLESVNPYDSSIKPMCFYGSSILQGACASRPGMAYPSILGRRLDKPIYNFGFSGNGQAEPEVAHLLAELDPSVYVLDCIPNLSDEQVTERMGPFIKILRAAHPQTPLVLVEQPWYTSWRWDQDKKRKIVDCNDNYKAVYETLCAGGVTNLHYVPGTDLYGHDGEATVDGVHATDVGFLRMVEVLEPVLKALV